MVARIIFILLFFLQINQGTAQTFPKEKLNFGLSVYPNISTGFALSGDQDAVYYKGPETTSFSYSIGLCMDYSFNKKQRWTIGLNYLKTGDRSSVYPPDVYRGFFYERTYKFQEHMIELRQDWNYVCKDPYFLGVGASATYRFGHSHVLYPSGQEGTKLDVSDFIDKRNHGVTCSLGFGRILRVESDQLMKISLVSQFHILRQTNAFWLLDHFPFRYYGAVGFQVDYFFTRRGLD